MNVFSDRFKEACWVIIAVESICHQQLSNVPSLHPIWSKTKPGILSLMGWLRLQLQSSSSCPAGFQFSHHHRPAEIMVQGTAVLLNYFYYLLYRIIIYDHNIGPCRKKELLLRRSLTWKMTLTNTSCHQVMPWLPSSPTVCLIRSSPVQLPVVCMSQYHEMSYFCSWFALWSDYRKWQS